jgi:prephenate dehydrogenase
MPDATMKTPHFDHVLIVGLGLIGGALAYRIREVFPDTKLYALARRQETVDEAIASGLFVQATTHLSDITAPIDLAIICVPIPQVVPMIEAVSAHFTHPMVITDVASVKEKLIAELDKNKIRGNHVVIWGHPMAGSEKTGFVYAKSVDVNGRPYILIESKNTELERFSSWVSQLGFRAIKMTAGTHDKNIAVVSHYAYWLHPIYAATVPQMVPVEEVLQVAGPGFYESIRRAGSDPDWGVQISQYNPEFIAAGLEKARDEIDHVLTLIRGKRWEELHSYLAHAKTIYDQSQRS